MADYINIKGQNIEVVASDPANPTQGQIWYNSTSNTLKGLGVSTAGAWATSGTMNNGRINGGSTGTQTAGLFFTGHNPPAPGNSNATESYDGSTWTTVPATVGTARYVIAYAGTQTAALAAGGYSTTDVSSVEEYDGSTWTTATSLPSVRRYPGGAGTQTAAVVIGGLSGPNYPGINNTEEYDGSTWTGGGAYPTALVGIGAAGTLTAAIASGGFNGDWPAFNSANEYNGSAWTSSNNLLNFRYPNDMSGIQTAALAFAGTPGTLSPGNPLAVESYDGTCFSADTNALATLDQGSGDTTATFAVSGDPTFGNTYNYNGPGIPTTVTITAS